MWWFAWIQLVMAVYTAAGYLLLATPCCRHAWHEVDSTEPPGRRIMAWDSPWLQSKYGNPEDGVLPTGPVVWGGGVNAGKKVPYKPEASQGWRAYCWNARNSADNLKYRYRWVGGPFKRVEIAGRWYFQAGWNNKGLPVISAGSF